MFWGITVLVGFDMNFHLFWMLSVVFLSHTTLLPHYPHSPYHSSLGLPIYLTASLWIPRKGMNDGCRQPMRQPVTRGGVFFLVPVLCSDWLPQCLFCSFIYGNYSWKGVCWCKIDKKEISTFSGIFFFWEYIYILKCIFVLVPWLFFQWILFLFFLYKIVL